MDSDKDKRIGARAYAKWENEGRPDGHHDRHWAEASDELAAEDGDAPDRLTETGDDTYTAELLAVETGISGDEAVGLIDRLGNDRAALIQAAQELRASKGDFGK